MSRIARRVLLAVPVVALTACNAMLGLEETQLKEPGLDASTEGGAGTAGGAGEGGDASVEADASDDASADGSLEADASGDAHECDAGTDGIGVVGQPCCVPNSMVCAGHAQRLVLYCHPTLLQWEALQSCSGKQLCSTEPGKYQGSCQDPVTVCMEAKPGDAVCEGRTRVECGPDLVTSTQTDCPNVCIDGECTGDCATGAVQCNKAVPQSCDDKGQWVDGAPCPYGCVAGYCAGVCVPEYVQCNGNVVQTCSATGEWQDGTTCSSVCLDGSCGGECLPGQTLCWQKVPQSCDLTGNWQNGPECPFVCNNGACAGVCAPGTKACSGPTPRSCSSLGAWVDAAPCTTVCVAGECASACYPGDTQCSDKVPQTCQANGQWQDGAECPYVCIAGSCAGACHPGESRCDGKVPQMCNASGQWTDGIACPFVCMSGACTGQCLPGAKQCAGLTVQTCDAAGQWQSGAPCQFVCAGGVCTGICAPGEKSCDKLVPRTCDANGQWQPGTACPYVCSEGGCTGVCSPSTKDCEGLTPRSCNAAGQWDLGVSCPYVCTAGTCSGTCSPGTKRCEGTIPQTCDSVGAWSSGAACPYTCSAGTCSGACSPGAKQCNGPVPQTCNNTGQWADGAACSGATPVCLAGVCTACAQGYADCDGLNQNGCEVNLNTTATHCGVCNNKCSSWNATPACIAGVCQVTCTAPFLNCDGAASNGCEENPATSTQHCGSCGNVCPARPNATSTCVNGVCGYTCKTAWVDCDGQASNGCESPRYMHVRTTGNDANPGTSVLPKASISAAVNAVCPNAEIRIAAGTYPLSTGITVKGNISLLGGYASDFTSRSLANVTLIQANFNGTAITLDGSTSPVTNEAVMEGLTVRFNATGTGTVTAVLAKTACPILRYNTLEALGASNATASVGVELRGPPTLCVPVVHSNFIHGGSGATARAILSSVTNQSQIFNNTMRASGSSASRVITLSGTARLINNIIFAAGTGTCIHEETGGNVTELRNNLVFDCPTFYHDAAGANLSAISVLNDTAKTTQVSGSAGGNITVASLSEVYFVSSTDLHLTLNTPASIRTGGYDLLSVVPNDRDGDLRDLPLSIGADEK